METEGSVLSLQVLAQITLSVFPSTFSSFALPGKINQKRDTNWMTELKRKRSVIPNVLRQGSRWVYRLTVFT